jgi:hypothetical protein
VPLAKRLAKGTIYFRAEQFRLGYCESILNVEALILTEVIKYKDK